MRLAVTGKNNWQDGRAAMIPLLLSVLLSSLGSSIANVALPTLSDAFSTHIQTTQWVATAYLLGATILTVVAGRLADRVGGRVVLKAGVALFATSSLLGAFAPSLNVLIAIRLVQGIGAATMLTIPLALIADLTPRSRGGRGIGLVGALSAAGTAMGPSLGGLLLDTFGWRSLFVVCAVLAAAILMLLVDTTPSAKRKTGAIASSGFPWAAIRRGPVPINLASTACVAAVVTGSLVVGPFYLERALGLRPAAVGLAMAVGPVVVVVGSIAAGKLADTIGPRRTTLAGSSVMLTGCAMLGSIGVSFALMGYLLSIAVLTFGYALFQTGNNKLVMDQAVAADRGVFSGMLNFSRNAGGAMGPALLGAAFASASAGLKLSDLTAQSAASGLQRTFAAAAVLVAVSIGSALAHGRPTASATARVNAAS
jgi:MFS family permease